MMKSKTTINLEKLFLIFILLDVILFPVSPFYSLPFSLAVSFWIFIKNIRKIRLEKPLKVFLGSIIISTFISILLKDRVAYIDNGVLNTIKISVQKEDIKRCIYFFIGLVIFKSTQILIVKYKNYANAIMKVILIFTMSTFVILFFIFKINYSIFVLIRNMMFNTDVGLQNMVALDASGYYDRYSFIFLDPNNSCYFISLICIFFIENIECSKILKNFAWIVLFISPFITRSTGGIYALLIYLFIKILLLTLKGKLRKKSMINYAIIALILIFCAFIDGTLGFPFINKIVDSQTATLERWANNSMSGRFSIYFSLIKSGMPPFIGNGYLILRNGMTFSPHSDHLRFLYSYGIISYICLIIIFAKKEYLHKKYFFLIPALIAFSINSLIDEPRFMYTFLLLLAYAITQDAGKFKEIRI